jgi:hypothetical protein
MSGTIHLITNGIFTGLAIIGFATLSNKIGKFIKIYESEKDEHFKNAFDKSMNETISDVHSCIESVSVITGGITKASSVGIDLVTGKKVLTRKKGKVAIVEQSKAQKQQMDELSQKLKKYESEIKRLKKKKSKKSHKSQDDSSLSGLSEEEEEEEEKEEREYTLE